MSARKTERLLNLVICLLATRRHLTVDQIREAVPQYAETASEEAFRRMFERDKEELRDLGIPLGTGTDSVWDDEAGYRIARRDYELPEVSLEADEAAAVGLAVRTWSTATLSGSASLALLKLRAAGVPVDASPVPTLEPRVEASEPAFPVLLEAVRDRRVVHFAYRGAGAVDAAERRVEPWGVVSWRGRWYLVGQDLDRADPRVFRLSRVVGEPRASGPAGAVQVPDGLDLVATVAGHAGGAPERDARVRVAPGRAGDLRREATAVEPRPGGWDELTVPYADAERLAESVVGYGADVVVVDPPEVRDAVVARLRAVLEQSE